jgi:hypothetical protein
MTAPTITTLPALPDASGIFSSDDADDFLAAWPAMITEANAQASWRGIHDPIVQIDGEAAEGEATIAEWVSGTSYAFGDVVWSPTNYLDYVRIVAGGGTTDPSAAPTVWQLVTGSGDATLTGAEIFTNKTYGSPAVTGCILEQIYAITDGGSVDIDPANGSIQTWELDANRTPTATNFANGQAIVLMVWDASWAVTWPSVTWVNAVTPILDPGRYSVIVLFKRDGTLYGKFVGNTGRAPTLDLELTSALDSRVTASGGANGTRVNSSGNIAAATTPRFDYSPTSVGSALGLLIEESRQSIVQRSDAFDNAYWSDKRATTVTANAATGPDGAASADKLVETTATDEHGLGRLASTPASSGVTHALSIYAKAGERTKMRFGTVFGINNLTFFVDLSTGAISNVSGGTSSVRAAVASGNSFWRVSATDISTSTEVDPYFNLVSSGTTINYTGDGSSGLYLYGIQLEQGAFPSSYIQTAGASVTRSADTLTMTGSNFSTWWDAAGGTFLVEADTPGVGTRPIISLDDDGTNEQIKLYTSGTSLKLTIIDGGSTVADITIGTITANTPFKVAFRIKANDVAVSLNGAAVSTDVSVTLPTVDR